MTSLIKMRRLILTALAMMVMGCTSMPMTFPTTLSKDLDLTRGREIRGESCGFQLLMVIPININDRYETAYNQLMSAAGNDKIANLSIEEKWFYAYFGTGYCTLLKATAYPLLNTPNISKKAIEEKLLILKDLRDKQLISEEQERARRQEIVDKL